MADKDVTYPDLGFDDLLQRTAGLDFALGNNAITPANSNNQTQQTSPVSVGGGTNGNTETQPVKSDGSLGDIWIKNFIRSENWKPKKVGFYIDGLTGYAEFMNVFVSGNIEALTGSIGGFQIGADYIRDLANSFGLASTVTGADDIRFWAGDTFANRAIAPFRITEAGVVTASSGTIGGNTLATDSISSVSFVSGPLGKGWRISSDGSAEFQNVSVRGIIKTSVFEKDTISAVNGIVLVSKADVLASDMTALDASTVVISGESSFALNEVIRMKDGTDDEWMLVTNIGSAPTYTVTRDLAGSYSANNNPIWKKGTAVVSMGVGSGTKTGFVLLDSSSANSPFIDVYGRNSNTYTDYTIHGRFGWLKGITDATVGLSATDVWGLYTDNAYIKGTIVASSGKIGGFDIGSDYLRDLANSFGLSSTITGGDDTRLWAGDTFANRATAPFNVSEAGNARVNVLTNKSILFETISAPAATDGQLWCAVNGSYKVLWGYFGGDTTNKQQVSMSRMFASDDWDNDNTGGGGTLTKDLEISTWFQPRSLDAKAFFQDSTGALIGVSYGFAQNGEDGVNTGIRISTVAKTNIVSDLSVSTANAVKATGLTTNSDPKIPAAINGAGVVTSYYNNSGIDVILGNNWGTQSFVTSLSWTNNSFSVLSAYSAWQMSDCLLSSGFDAVRTNLNAYVYVLSWTDTKITIRIVCKAGYRIFCHFGVIG